MAELTEILNPLQVYLKSALIDELDKLSNVNPNEFLDNRINKYDALGYFEEG